MYLVSLFPAAFLAVAVIHQLMSASSDHNQQIGFPILVSIIVCVIHAAVLVMYPIRRTKPLALLLGAMAFVSLVCLFLLLVSSQPNYQVHSVGNLPAPK
jgi:uncharacterized membrane protein HdeD (DUF308 family)